MLIVGPSPAGAVLDAAVSNSSPEPAAPAEGVNVGSPVWVLACVGGLLTSGSAMQVVTQ